MDRRSLYPAYRRYGRKDGANVHETLDSFKPKINQQLMYSEHALNALDEVLNALSVGQLQNIKRRLSKIIPKLSNGSELMGTVDELLNGVIALGGLHRGYEQRITELRSQLAGARSMKSNGVYTPYARYRAAAVLRSKSSGTDAVTAEKAAAKVDVALWLQTLVDANARLKKVIALFGQLENNANRVRNEFVSKGSEILKLQNALPHKFQRDRLNEEIGQMNTFLDGFADGLAEDAQYFRDVLKAVELQQQATHEKYVENFKKRTGPMFEQPKKRRVRT